MIVLIYIKRNVDMDECNLNCYRCPTDGKCQPLIGTYTCLCKSTNYISSNCEIPDPPIPTEPTKLSETLILKIVLGMVSVCASILLLLVILLTVGYLRQRYLYQINSKTDIQGRPQGGVENIPKPKKLQLKNSDIFKSRIK